MGDALPQIFSLLICLLSRLKNCLIERDVKVVVIDE